MTRKKLNLAYIPNDSLRKATFNKRKKGLMKKIHELSVLCGIEACAMIYSPFSAIPEVWPSNLEVRNVVERFEMLPDVEKERKMVNHEGFLRQSISKAMENTNKKMKENSERTMKEAMFHFLSGKGEQLTLNDADRENLCKYIDQYLKELYQHRETLSGSHFEFGESSSVPNHVMAPTPVADVGSSSSLPNLHVFNSPQLTNDSWAPRPMIASNQMSDWVHPFPSDFYPGTAVQESSYPMVNPVGVYDLPNLSYPNHNQYPFGYPNMAEDGMCNLNVNQQKTMFVDYMNHPGEMEMALNPLMNDNNRYYPHQP